MELLKSRAIDKFDETKIVESYEGSVVVNGLQYTYGRNADFYKGDWVTIKDEKLGLTVNAQIIEVTKTWSGEKQIIDVTFGSQGMTLDEKLRRKGVLN